MSVRIYEGDAYERRYGSPESRFWAHVNPMMDDRGCWEWSSSAAYPLVHAHGEMIGAHRFSLMIHGVALRSTDVVCHRCDNPTCVNPAHLFVGTQSDNLRDMVAKGRHPLQCRPRPTCDRGHAFVQRPSGKACVTCERARGAAYRARRRAAR